jgi:acetyl-CoA synthetase
VERGETMIDSSLYAPTKYNIVDEIEKFSQDEKRNALIIVDENQHVKYITYKQLLNLANRYANVFADKGFKKGNIILIMLPKSLEVYAVYIAALKMGLQIIPCSDQLRAKDIDYRIQHAKAKGLIYHANYIQEVSQLNSLNEIKLFVIDSANQTETNLNWLAEKAKESYETVDTSASDIAFIAYTSGTTGTPKGAIHPHSWGYVHLKTVVKDWLNISERDLVWATAAPGWQKWIWSPFLATLGSGATALVYEGKFHAETYLKLIASFSVNVLCCTPTEYRMMIKSEDFVHTKLTTLRSAVSAGEPLNREVIERFNHVHHVLVRDGYGQTENTLLVGTMRHMEARPGSMGKPTPGNIVEIIDYLGEPVPIGQVGDIAVHIESPALFKGYYNEPERTAMQFRGDWYITGDRARKDEDGYFWFEGRADDMIISAGYTIGPFDIEDALLKHPLVQECAVVASPDEIRGSVVKAFVVLKDFEDTKREGIIEELQNHVKAVMAPYCYPREIEFLEELPKTMSGKIRRVELRRRAQNKMV